MKHIALLLLILSGFANAGEVSLGAGQCLYGLAHYGTFYQSDRYTNNYMHPTCWAGSYRDQFSPGYWSGKFESLIDAKLGFEIGWHDFGKAEGRGNRAVGDEEAGIPGLVCDPSTGRGCEAKFDTWGRVRGLELSLTGTWKWGGWFSRGKTGLLFYDMKTHSDVTYFDGSKAEYHEYSGFLNRPAWGFGFAIGHKLDKNWSVEAGFTRWFWIGEHRQLSIVENDLTQFLVGMNYSF